MARPTEGAVKAPLEGREKKTALQVQSGKNLFLRVSALEGGLTVGLDDWFSLDLDYWLLFKGLGCWFSDLDVFVLKGYGSRSLLIQRCKKHRRQRNFFAEGSLLPDERQICPTNAVNLTLLVRNGFPVLLVKALMNQLKRYGICLAVLVSLHAYGQNKKLSVTLCPLAALDFMSFPTIQGGIEYRFTPALSWYNEFGVEYKRSWIGLADTTILRPHGIKAKTELRYYFPGSSHRSILSRGHYVALNAFLTSDTHNTEVHYLYNKDTSLPREDAFGVRKKVWGLNLVYGRQQMMSKRFGWDLYLGLGIRFRYITTADKEVDYYRDYLVTPIDLNIPAARARTEVKGGFSMVPNLTAGIRFFYRL